MAVENWKYKERSYSYIPKLFQSQNGVTNQTTYIHVSASNSEQHRFLLQVKMADNDRKWW